MRNSNVVVVAFSFVFSAAAFADVPVSLGLSGATERAGLTQDARKNPTAASFGAPIADDRRLFKLRWRLPWLFSSSLGVGPGASGLTSTGFAVGGMNLAMEPMQELSSLVPQLEIGEAHKLAHLQVGALSYSLGHRTLVDAMTNSPDGLARKVGVLAEANLAGLGASVAVGDVLQPQSFVSARVHGRPLMWFGAPDATFQPNELDIDPRTELLGIWVIGASGAADFDAPANVGTGVVAGYGVDNEAAILDNQVVKLIAAVDVNALTIKDAGGSSTGFGVHPGLQLMLDLAGVRVDVDGELNVGGDGYQPRMFDRLYGFERVQTLGSGKPKLALERPGSWGYQARAQVSAIEMVTVFAEVRDQLPFDDQRGSGNLTTTIGASTWIVLAGGAVTATQTGMAQNALFGPGFVVTAEGRVALLLNTLHVVGRTWRAHIAAGDDPGEFVVDEGASLGLEVNFDVF
ncbi:MAG: hypothetical protein Q8O67_18170 [Deltaproteobacteria bacterium]|nr:hypothetical protein [Deltaproteobacteria bacterium]